MHAICMHSGVEAPPDEARQKQGQSADLSCAAASRWTALLPASCSAAISCTLGGRERTELSLGQRPVVAVVVVLLVSQSFCCSQLCAWREGTDGALPQSTAVLFLRKHPKHTVALESTHDSITSERVVCTHASSTLISSATASIHFFLPLGGSKLRASCFFLNPSFDIDELVRAVPYRQ